MRAAQDIDAVDLMEVQPVQHMQEMPGARPGRLLLAKPLGGKGDMPRLR